MKIIKHSLLLIFPGLLLLACGALFWIVNSLSSPYQMDVGSPPQNLSVQEITFYSHHPAQKISGWLIQGNADRGSVLLMHGVRSNRHEMLARAFFLNQAGYTVLLFDFQAHGESEGDMITFGYRESKNADAALNYLKQQYPDKPVGVIGMSLGGASALLGSVAKAADALVLEAVFSTFEEAVANRIALRLGPLGRYLSPLLMWQVEIRLGINPQWLSPVDRIREVKTPVLIIAGEEDKRTTMAESKMLFSQASEPREFWSIPGANHQNFHQYARKDYETKILDFFETYL